MIAIIFSMILLCVIVGLAGMVWHLLDELEKLEEKHHGK